MVNDLKSLFLKYKEMIAYLFFGVCSTVVNIAAYYISYQILDINNVTSTIIAWFLAVLFAFITNKFWVFESTQKKTQTILFEFFSFLSCRIITGALDVLIMWYAVDIMHMNSLLFKIISNIIVVILNYIASKYFIFKEKNNT